MDTFWMIALVAFVASYLALTVIMVRAIRYWTKKYEELKRISHQVITDQAQKLHSQLGTPIAAPTNSNTEPLLKIATIVESLAGQMSRVDQWAGKVENWYHQLFLEGRRINDATNDLFRRVTLLETSLGKLHSPSVSVQPPSLSSSFTAPDAKGWVPGPPGTNHAEQLLNMAIAAERNEVAKASKPQTTQGPIDPMVPASYSFGPPPIA